ncbi:MAG: hypothetical protein JSV92_04355 [archaeon]|nr:MAG: hypothetical protein JSV92_04355 [archaeon]
MKKGSSLGHKGFKFGLLGSWGQSQIIGVVLLTLVMITMVGITYMWGMPMIEKQKDTVKISNLERFMKELDDKIQTVAKNGGNQRLESPSVPGELSMFDSGINDRIELKIQTSGLDIAKQTDIYLRGTEEGEVPIGNTPGVIKVYVSEMSDAYDVNMTLYYRNLTGSGSVYLIDLVGLGRDNIIGEGHNIVISEGNEVPVKKESGISVYTTRINVRFE